MNLCSWNRRMDYYYGTGWGWVVDDGCLGRRLLNIILFRF